MKTIAIIPAKGKSERLPRKNLMRVSGYTLLERSMMCVPPGIEIVIATDDDEIERVAMSTMCVPRGSERRVFRLSDELAARDAHLEPVIAAVLARSQAQRVVLLQPTSPLRRRTHVESCLAIQHRHGCDSVVTVTESAKQVYFGGTLDMKTGEWVPRRNISERRFTTNIPGNWHENGAVYVFTREHFERTGNRLGGHMRAVTMPERYSIDVDTPEELERAQLLAGDRVAEVT